ncbi:type 4a pilus biogenesis protein PilO [Pokkaliibacter sp. CJK22405]|uniref:type 4a pilus biogenesis protein PilO n=1 Tax=Pokkaliibacter sp. CJK22405 TaxID=3384615 RepID=UPI0039851A8B
MASKRGLDFKRYFAGFDVNNVNLSEAGTWPIGIKVIFIVILFVAVTVAGNFLLLTDQQTQLESLKRDEPQLKAQITKKSEVVSGLPMYQTRLKELENRFKELLTQLPQKQEVPGLLDQMTNLGKNSGLTFRQIALQPEQKATFYQILPIDISVYGSYHAMGEFAYGLAALPRIVTLHDFTLTPQDDGSLQMVLRASTYRYLDDSDDSMAGAK